MGNHRQRVVLLCHGNNDVFTSYRLRHQLDDLGRDRRFGQIDVGQLVLLRHRSHDLFAGGITEPLQTFANAILLLLGHLLSFRQLLRANQSLFDENLGELGHRWWFRANLNASLGKAVRFRDWAKFERTVSVAVFRPFMTAIPAPHTLHVGATRSSCFRPRQLPQ